MSKRNVTATMKKKVASDQKWNCKICSNMLDECYEIDHIICIKDGGTNEDTNLQALCPNCHRKKTNNDMAKKKEKIKAEKEKEPKEPKEKEPKEKKEKKEKVALPVFWNEYVDKNEPYNKFACGLIKNKYPDLVWNKDMKLTGYTVDELKIIHASIQGKFRNGSKTEIISFIEDYAKKMAALNSRVFTPYGVGYRNNYRY